MKDKEKTKEQLVAELDFLRQRNAELEAREREYLDVSEALKQSEARFRTLSEKAVVGVYLIQNDRFKYINPEMARIFGYEVKELLNRKGPLDLVCEEDQPLVRENLRKRISGEVDAINFRFRGITKDKQIIDVEAYGSRTDEQGQPAIVGTLLDISDRVRRRREREEELRKFQGLYELALAMTAERSLEENLALIVETSRSLLRADKSFLALRDEGTNELFMHTLSGIVTDEFKSLKIPVGIGLGGKVAESGQLYVVQDYFKEIGPAFHDVVRAEGLLAGVAVPVQVGRTNVGVLYVFNRARTPFSQADLDTLSTLGNLAAVEITRKQALEQLQEGERRIRRLYEQSKRGEELYESLLNSSADAIVIYDMEGRTQYVSQYFTRTFGWTLDELEGMRIPFVPDSEREATMAEIEKIVRDGTPTSAFETKRLTRDGRILDISISASRFHDHQGVPAGVLAILRDITDRKSAEDELRKSQEKYRELYEESERSKQRYRTLLDVSPDPIVVYDMEGKASYTNSAFTSVFGWTFGELEGKRTDFVPDENWPETREMIDRVLRGESFRDQETRRYTKEGLVIDVSISGAAFLDKKGKPSGSVVHIRDITRRKQAAADLAAELDKFQALYELALAMTAERALDENLALIVDKSRELLSADISFIALRDETAGDLYMHTLSGIRTEEFKALRIPLGVGLGGKVAETGRLYVVEDYLEEIGPAFHDVARAEGFISGIAVPVQIGRTNVGVLYVFNRTKTPFSQADLDTLSLLGNLAAVEITRRRAQERLREREESYRKLYEEAKRREELYVSLLNSSADAIVIYDMEGRAQYVSPSFTRIFGWTMDEVEGRKIPFVPDDELAPTMQIIRGLIRDGTPCSAFETKRFTKDRRVLEISISASRYRDHEGNPAGLLVTLRDITFRKRAEAALMESEERFRTLAEVAPFGLVVMSADEQTEYLNPKFTELFGYSVEDLPDLDAWFLKAYPDKAKRAKAETIWRADRAEIRVEYGIGAEANPRVFSIKCKDDRLKIVSFRAVVLADGRVISTFLDVTSEVEAQQEILRAKNEWERTFNSVSDLIIILDSEQKIVRANRAASARLGMTAEHMIGLDPSDLADRGIFPASLCPDSQVLADGGDYSAEVFDEKLGAVFDLRVSPLLDNDGNPMGSVNVARDITAFKAMERARRLAVNHLAHELRTPVAIIKGSVTDLAEEDLPGPARQRRVDRIKRSLNRLTELQAVVREIVFPRRYEPAHMPVTETLHEILEEIRSRISHRSVTLVTRAELIESDIIDPTVFRYAVNTLVKNAIENTPDGGEVAIRLKKLQADILFQVADHGIGIPWSDREFLFKAFHQTQDSERYSTRNPFDFDAGGKGLELMGLKILSEEGFFSIGFESQRCRYIAKSGESCPGSIRACRFAKDIRECEQSGGTTFSVLFQGHPGKPGVSSPSSSDH